MKVQMDSVNMMNENATVGKLKDLDSEPSEEQLSADARMKAE